MKLFVPVLDNGHGMVCKSYMMSVLAGFKNQQVTFWSGGGSCPTTARNNAAAAFLDSDCDRMLFIDADIIFTGKDVDIIASRPEHVVTGFYCARKTGNPQYVLGPLNGMRLTNTQMLELAWSGAGFLCIHREAFERIKAKFPTEIEYDVSDGQGGKKTRWNFFPVLVRNRTLIQEDGGFCDLYRRSGGRIFAHPLVELGHEGPAVFPIRVSGPLHTCAPPGRA